jgi:hypothetical protein
MFDSWLVSRTRSTYVLEVLQSEPPRLAPYLTGEAITATLCAASTKLINWLRHPLQRRISRSTMWRLFFENKMSKRTNQPVVNPFSTLFWAGFWSWLQCCANHINALLWVATREEINEHRRQGIDINNINEPTSCLGYRLKLHFLYLPTPNLTSFGEKHLGKVWIFGFGLNSYGGILKFRKTSSTSPPTRRQDLPYFPNKPHRTPTQLFLHGGI